MDGAPARVNTWVSPSSPELEAIRKATEEGARLPPRGHCSAQSNFDGRTFDHRYRPEAVRDAATTGAAAPPAVPTPISTTAFYDPPSAAIVRPPVTQTMEDEEKKDDDNPYKKKRCFCC